MSIPVYSSLLQKPDLRDFDKSGVLQFQRVTDIKNIVFEFLQQSPPYYRI